jgi:DNA-directed RNA polymerase subunit RPC12/RpoP
MTSSVQVVCPNPACSHRIVEGENVTRESWDATWLDGRQEYPPYWHSDVACPACGTEGIDPESGQLDSAEEELGTRCKFCGVVSHGGVFTSAHADPPTDAWGNRIPRECPHCHEPEAFTEDPA